MSFFSRVVAALGGVSGDPQSPQAAASSQSDVYGDLALLAALGQGFSSRNGRVINERSAMSNATFNRAVTLISSSIGMLPLNVMRRIGERKEKAEELRAYRILKLKPNKVQTPFQFKSYMQGRALLKGNAFAQVIPGVGGAQALWPLNPDLVTIEVTDSLDVQYRYQPKQGSQRVFSSSEIMHLRSPWTQDGFSGEGLLKQAVETLSLADLTDQSAARLLENGAYVGGVLEHEGNLSEEAISRLRAQFEEKFSGVENQGKWIITEEGLKAKPMGFSGRDAEGLGQRRYQAEEMSRFTGVPRPLLSFDETSWGSGVEQLGLFFVMYCLLPWFNAWEEAVAKALLTEREQKTHYVKFNEGALLRGSLKDQADFLSKALGGPGQGGFMLPDEAREKMDMNPLPERRGQQPAWMIEGTSNE
ncbi:MAG: phage portal protein [Pseudomonadota bacterium]